MRSPGPTKVFSTLDHRNVIAEWELIVVDLTPLEGRSVRVRFAFDTVDGRQNRFPGWWLDEVEVRSLCGVVSCQVDEDCPPSGDCAEARCVGFVNVFGGYCRYEPCL